MSRSLLFAMCCCALAGCGDAQPVDNKKAPVTDEKALQLIKAEGNVRPPETGIKPRLTEVTLQWADNKIKPTGKPVKWRQEFEAAGRTVAIEEGRITAFKSSDRDALWSNSVQEGRLAWLAHLKETAYLRAYKVNEHKRFSGYVKPSEILMIDLRTGKWLKPLMVAFDTKYEIKEMLAVKANANQLAVLSSLIEKKSDDKDAGEQVVAAYHVACFKKGGRKASWARTFKAEPERGYGGAYVWGITIAPYAHAENTKLNWMGKMLLVSAEAMQPIVALNGRDGSTAWHMERIWEYERGFIGPSVYSHFLARMGNQDSALGSEDEETVKAAQAARKKLEQQYDFAIVGGPVVVPLRFERGTDKFSIFVAVSKGPNEQWSGYLSDCVVYELNDSGKPVSMVKLPQLVSGGRFQVMPEGLVWSGQNDSLVKLLPSRSLPVISMGGGGSDLITRLEWFRQLNWSPPKVWLQTARANTAVVFGKTHALRLPGGGYVSKKAEKVFQFPVSMVDLETSRERQLTLVVPFDGELSLPKTNYRSDGQTVTTRGPYVLSITQLGVSSETVDVTLGMENWSARLRFPLADLIK